MPRMQSKVSSGDAGKKGDSTQATGTDVGPQRVDDMSPLSAHLPGNFAAVTRESGDGVIPAGAAPLQGHFAQPALAARGNAAKRGPGKKSPSNPTEIT